MKHKNRYLNAALFFLLVVFGGCLNYEQTVTLDADGSGSMEIHYWLSESTVKWFSSGSTLGVNKEDVNKQYEGEGITVKEVKIENRVEDSTRHVWVKLKFNNLTSLSKVHGLKDYKYEWRRNGDTALFVQKTDQTESTDMMGLDKYTVTYTYKFPGNILTSNATSVSGSTATWKYKLSESGKRTLTAKILVQETGFWRWVIVLGILGAVVCMIVFIAKRRKKS
jgi:hypothetical protein